MVFTMNVYDITLMKCLTLSILDYCFYDSLNCL